MWQIKDTNIQLKRGDITELEVDAIVNAANTKLILGGGVAGAIRKKGGSTIQKECNNIGPVKLGEAVITRGGNLNVKFIIHAASMHLGGRTTAESLKDSVWNSLRIGSENMINSIAFPAIGTGIAGFPLSECAEIMINTFNLFLLNETHNLRELFIVLFSESDYKKFMDIFKRKLN
ncbi:MAG: macro domain-containing protein [Asgard group archaeon]|nr:macro domain-containing protein [Asgard group archaeon]